MTSQPDGLDDTNRRIVQFIQQFHTAHRHGPSLEEIGWQVGMTRQGARWRVARLIQGGWLDHQPGRPRTLKVVRPM